MKIDREEHQGGISVARHRIAFCLEQMEKANKFENNLQWESEITRHLTIEELIGALVAAEQELKGVLVE